MTPTKQNHRILQIHPTRRCNLQCLHCYSSSGPQERDQLSVNLFTQAITDASQQGYTVASFSGGEPILYKPLRQLLDHAHAHQMRTAVVSNGTLLDEKHLEQLAGAIDVLAISLDGMPASHNRMRNLDKAFDLMMSRLPGIRALGIPFGFVFTLTHQNFREFDWVANFALEQGASLLQIHPLEETGRAQQTLMGVSPSAKLSAYAYLKAKRLRQSVGDRLHVQLDLIHQEVLRAYPQNFFAVEDTPLPEAPLADLVSPLIIEPDGTVVPLQYGFARSYALGNLQMSTLPGLADAWRQEVYPQFLKLCREVHQQMLTPTELPIADWYGTVAQYATQPLVA